MSFQHAVRRFLALRWVERGLFIQSILWILRAEVRLRFDRSRRELIEIGDRRPEAPYLPTSHELQKARNYARWISAAARYVPLREPARCLHQSIGLRDWLRSEGIPARLQIGVCMIDQRLQAHAWVELGTTVVSDDEAQVAPFQVLKARSPRDSDALQVAPRSSGRESASGWFFQ